MSTTMIKLKRLLSYLQRTELVKYQVLAYISILSLHASLREHYRKNYGTTTSEDINCDDNQTGTMHKLGLDEKEMNMKLHTNNQSECKFFSNIKWRDFPKPPKLFVAFRAYTTIWMIYILIRYWFSDYIGAQVGKFIVLQLPIKCYLLGRFIISRKLAEVTAVIFSGPHLAWRLVNSLVGHYYSGLVYFMLLDEHDLELVYLKFGHNKSLNLEPDVEERLNPRERLLIETMCYRIRSPTKVMLKLRANRTREAHLRLRRKIAIITLVASLLMVPLTISLTLGFIISQSFDERYLSVYQGCDSELQERFNRGLIGPWSLTWTLHRVAVSFGDTFENIAVWVENGFMALLVAVVPFILNYDLFLHWKGIDKKINHLTISDQRKRLQQLNATTISRTTIIGKSTDLRSKGIAESILEMDDFFNQYKRASYLLEVCLDGAMTCSLVMCSSYTYFTRIKGITRLPLDIIAVLAFLTTTLAVGIASHLRVHRACLRSYPKLCSLMAYDLKKHEHDYGTIMEYYATRRTCVKLLKHYPFLPTTFLTVIGWTFSCFFIISELLDRRIL